MFRSLPKDEAERLGVLADSLDQYDLMRAISRCDELVSQLRALQLIHSQNLCRVANHLASTLPEDVTVKALIINGGIDAARERRPA